MIYCTCEDPGCDYCPLHAPERHDTAPGMPAFREVVAHDDEDDRWIVPADIFASWLALQEPRIPLRAYVDMFAEIGEELPTMPETPVAIASEHDTDPPPSGP